MRELIYVIKISIRRIRILFGIRGNGFERRLINNSSKLQLKIVSRYANRMKYARGTFLIYY